MTEGVTVLHLSNRERDGRDEESAFIYSGEKAEKAREREKERKREKEREKGGEVGPPFCWIIYNEQRRLAWSGELTDADCQLSGSAQIRMNANVHEK